MNNVDCVCMCKRVYVYGCARMHVRACMCVHAYVRMPRMINMLSPILLQCCKYISFHYYRNF